MYSRHGIQLLLLSIASSLPVGCASISFHPENGNQRKDKGFLYYPPKPYLVVEPTEKGEKVRVVVLPDLKNASRVRQNPGWGTTQFSFSTTNGVITTFNAANDSKAAETLTGLLSGAGGILSGVGSIAAARTATDAAGADAALLTAFLGAFKIDDLSAKAAAGPYDLEVAEFVKVAALLENEATNLRALPEKPRIPLEVADGVERIANNLRKSAKFTLEVKPEENKRKEAAAIIAAYGKAKTKLQADARGLHRRLSAQTTTLASVKDTYTGKTRDIIVIALSKLEGAGKDLAKYAGVASGGNRVRIYEIQLAADGTLKFQPQPLR